MKIKDLCPILLLLSIGLSSCLPPKRVYKKPTYETPDAEIVLKTSFELQSFLKTTNATVDDMKKYVSVDVGCPIDKIIVKDLFEAKGAGIYILDVCGEDMKYKRTGSVFFKDGEEPYNTK